MKNGGAQNSRKAQSDKAKGNVEAPKVTNGGTSNSKWKPKKKHSKIKDLQSDAATATPPASPQKAVGRGGLPSTPGGKGPSTPTHRSKSQPSITKFTGGSHFSGPDVAASPKPGEQKTLRPRTRSQADDENLQLEHQ